MSANQEGSDFELLIELFEGNEESLKEVISIFLKDLPISILKSRAIAKMEIGLLQKGWHIR
jgi:hypothetical protein